MKRKKTSGKAADRSTQKPPPAYRAQLTFLFPILLLLVCLGYYLWAVSIGWDHTITDLHDFRQTQTAICTYYMAREPFKLAYEMPVLGPPWSIPLEFPIYEWVVASILKAFHTNLDQTGRFVSVAFYLLTLLPAWMLLGSLKVAP